MYRTFAKKESEYRLRQNTSQFFAFMEKYGQIARETKPLIFRINSEKPRKKERTSLTITYIRSHLNQH